MSGFATRALDAHIPDGKVTSISTPIFASATYRLDSAAHGAALCENSGEGYLYSRWANPTVDSVAKTICSLEKGAATIMTGSGMGAIATTLLSLLNAGDHIVAANCVYGGTFELLSLHLSRMGVEVSYVPPEIDAFRAARRENTKVFYGETPANPTLTMFDLKEFAEMAHDFGALAIVDGTMASVYNQQPLELGIDVSLHSCTKYMGGHSDLIAGCITVRDIALEKKIWEGLKVFGSVLSPFEAFLLARGIKTLEVRMEKHNSNALQIATFLSSHPAVTAVHYPLLPSHPQYEVCKRQMKGGGGMIAFDVGSLEAARQLVENVKVITLAVSLGGVESLIEHAASMTHTMVPQSERLAAGITDGLIRFSVGIESCDDLIQDLQQALDKIKV